MFATDANVRENTPELMPCITPTFSESAKEDDPANMDGMDGAVNRP